MPRRGGDLSWCEAGRDQLARGVAGQLRTSRRGAFEWAASRRRSSRIARSPQQWASQPVLELGGFLEVTLASDPRAHGLPVSGLGENDYMSKQRPAARDLRTQIRTTVDPTGETFRLLDAVAQNPKVPSWLSALASGLDGNWADLGAIGQQYQVLLADMEDALRLLVPRGWAVFHMDSDVVRQAVAMVMDGRGSEADRRLADQWGPDTYRTKRVCDRVRSMGAAEQDYGAVFVRRSELLRKAKDHHDHGRYEASVPMLHGQMEGITTDVAGGGKFFTRRSGSAASVVDPTQLVSIEASLAALQHLYTESVDQTQVAGSVSRHGVAHGRELAYDTNVNSAKCWSVLDALVEWALPLARQEADRLRAERQTKAAGSAAVDEDGRRLDDREFAETKKMLRVLQTSSMGWWRQRGQFRNDLIGGVYETEDFVKRGLPADHGTKLRTSTDCQQVWFWRQTVSGWVLGIGMTANDRGFMEWLYSAETPPPTGPLDAPEAWGDVFDTPPDWTR